MNLSADAIERSEHAPRRALLGVDPGTPTRPLTEAIRHSGSGWAPLATLALLGGAEQLQPMGLLILGPEIASTLGVTAGLMVLLFAVRALVASLAALPIAASCGRRASRSALARGGSAGWAVATILSALVRTAGGLFGATVLHGAASGSVPATHGPLLMDIYPPGVRARSLLLHRAGVALGSLFGVAAIGLATHQLGLTWRGTLVALGALAVAAPALSRRLTDPGFGRWDEQLLRASVGHTEAADGGARTPPVALGFFEVCRRALSTRTARALIAASALLGGVVLPLNVYVLFFLDEQWQLAPGQRALFLALVLAGSIPAIIGCGPRAEAWFRRDAGEPLRQSGRLLLLLVGGLTVAATAPVLAVVFVAFVIVFSALAVVVPLVNLVLLSSVLPNARAHVSAMAAVAAAGVGGMLGLLLLEGIDHRFGTRGAIAALCLPAVLAALVLRSAAAAVEEDVDHLIDAVIEDEEVDQLVRQGGRPPLLSCRHIDFSYGTLQVLFDVDFTIDDGEMVALLGTNGAGKSTLLRVISGLALPSRGTVHFQGRDITYVAPARRPSMGISAIPGGKAVFGPLAVVENLRLYGAALGPGQRNLDQRIDAVFETFPRLAERRNQAAATLSGGEQQMLALGKAIMLEPRLLLIDELSLGLAPKVVGELLEIVRRINEGGTAVVLVEQSVNVALSLVRHAYFMEKGAIRFDGPAADLLERPDLLRSVFLEGASGRR